MNEEKTREKMKIVKPEAGTPVTVSIGAHAFMQMFENIGGPLGFLSQLSENATDANATRVDITIDAKAKIITVRDNGIGMGSLGRNAFASVGLSFKPENTNPKGRHGTGAKSVYGVASKMEVFDRSRSDGDTRKVTVLSISLTELIERYTRANTAPFPTTLIPVPDGFPETGVEITISDFKPHRFVKEDRVLERLGEELAPATADKVFVNGKPLLKREIIGERVVRHWEHPVLGSIDVDIYMPKNRKADLDRLRMGAMGPVCNFGEFVQNILDPWHRQRIPKCYTNPYVCGIIDVAVFNNYSVQGRKSFDGALYANEKDLLAEFITFLETQLGPIVSEMTEDQSSISTSERVERTLADIETMFADTFGPAITAGPEPEPIGRPPKTESWVTLNARRIELVVGDSQEFYVIRAKQGSGSFVWDATASGGATSGSKGKRITYTAGDSPGSYILRVSDAENPELSATIAVTLVAERTFKLSPSSITLVSGESTTIRAKNIQVTSGEQNLEWSSDGGRLAPTRGGEVKFTAGIIPGTYTVECRDSKRESQKASCEVVVLPFEDPPPPDDWAIRIENEVYLLESCDLPDVPEIAISSAGNNRIHLNWAHSSVVKADGEGRAALRHLITSQIVLIHVFNTDADATGATVFARTGSLLASLSRGESGEK